MTYIAKQHLAHDQYGFVVRDDASGRWLGGLGANYYRPWVYPLYTPAGVTVIQEFPFDHPFHNGLWIAQGPIYFQGKTVHLWPMPPERKPGEMLFTHLGRMESVGLPTVETHENGVRFTLHIIWRTGEGIPVLDEIRTVDLYAHDDATICDLTSVQTATYGALEYGVSKFGSACVRVEPRLLPTTGGEVVADGGRRGKAEVALQQPCDYVAYEGVVGPGQRAGVLLAVPGQRPHTWFIRDYGLATYNPTMEHPVQIAASDSWQVNLRVAAYDGVLDDARARVWLSHAP